MYAPATENYSTCTGASVINVVYDSDGRMTTHLLTTVLPTQGSSCATQPQSTGETRTYDAENHTVTDTCPNNLDTCFGTLNPNTYGYGATGKLRLLNNNNGGSVPYTLHWDGDTLLFETDSTGKLVFVNIEGLGFLWDNSSVYAGTSVSSVGQLGLGIMDRNSSDELVATHGVWS